MEEHAFVLVPVPDFCAEIMGHQPSLLQMGQEFFGYAFQVLPGMP